jgi:hypothetical protein
MVARTLVPSRLRALLASHASIPRPTSAILGRYTMRHRVLVGLSLTLVLALTAACATSGNTLAQDLAWERWNQCKHISGISLKEIKTDGTIWVYYNHGINAWQDCDREAAKAQGARRVGSSQPSPASQAVAVGGATGPIPLPVWKIGSEWAYRYEIPSGTGTFVWTVDRIQELNGEPNYVLKSGSRNLFYRVSDLSASQETVNGEVVRLITPPEWRFVAFPLSAGTSWEMKFQDAAPVDRTTTDIHRSCKAEGEETVTVPAGTFSTIRVVCKNLRNGERVLTVWYSRDVTHIVRGDDFVSTGGKRLRELLSYRLR